MRHALAPAFQVDSPEAVTRALTVLHATEAATVYLSCWARMGSLEVADLGRALYADRSLVKQLAMRRTLFVFPRDLLPAAWSSASARVAGTERARLAKDVVKGGLADDGDAWVDQARTAVLDVLADAPDGLPAIEVRRAVPMVDVKLVGTAGGLSTSARVLTLLGVSADIVRGTNTGGWHTSRPRWTRMQHWLDDQPTSMQADDGYRELVRRWLHTFGPGTEDDIVWWLGSTKGQVRSTLASLDVVEVELDGGATGWMLADDLDEVPDPGPWVALLPVLDPTAMGWKGRDFYLGPHRDQVFDTNGNAGATVWVDGRVVGAWLQDPAGAVEVRLLEKVSARSRRAIDDEAARLTSWLAGLRVPTIYKSPASTPTPPTP